MRILSMTATFGKLNHSTLTLQPGLNIIEAPNEWGKSTWCAFLVAMLYGIETRQQTTRAALADKERFAPWSGQPMSGRMDILWNGREITLERSTKGRIPLGVFRAYETHSGLPVAELSADNCGQTLLGVEKEVFLRAGFLKLSDLPLTQNEALRRRLNSLVTTGDESGDGERLAQKLNKLKNEVWVNRSKGLLPKAREQLDEVCKKLEQLDALQAEQASLLSRQQEVEQFRSRLETHRTALQAAAHRQLQEQQAQARRHAARQLAALEQECSGLPDREALQHQLLDLQQLEQQLLSAQMELQLLPQPPEPPICPVEGCTDPDSARQQLVRLHQQRSALEARLRKKHFPLWVAGILLLAFAAGVYLVHPLSALCTGAVGLTLTFAGIFAAYRQRRQTHQLRQQLMMLETSIPEADMSAYCQAYNEYRQELAHSAQERQELEQRLRLLQGRLQTLGDIPLSTRIQQLQTQLSLWQQLADARREQLRTPVQTITAPDTIASIPEDTLTCSESDTNRLLSDCGTELRQLQLRLGSCQGQMTVLGQRDTLTRQQTALEQRCKELETTYSAIVLAQKTLAEATAQLQKRFAPRISHRAQELFSRLTGGRYDRLTLTDALTVQAGAADEDILRSALWRSDGTADQLYLAVRLAVAGELTPHAPLILDDALVRFDDARLRAALLVLQEEAAARQVLLFTCQGREQALLNRRDPT